MEFEHIQCLVESILGALLLPAITMTKPTRPNGSVPRSSLEKWNVTG